MTIEVYSFEDADGTEQGYTTQDYSEAKRYAQEYRLLIIANTFEWSEAEPVDDYRPRTKRKQHA
jgi:hypothetical protein